MKKLIYLSLLVLCSFQLANAQETKTIIDTAKRNFSLKFNSDGTNLDVFKFSNVNNPNEKKLLYIVDDTIIEYELMKIVDPNKIASINILKGNSAIAAYGEQAKNGVIIISTKDYVPKKTIK